MKELRSKIKPVPNWFKIELECYVKNYDFIGWNTIVRLVGFNGRNERPFIDENGNTWQFSKPKE